MNSNRLRAYAAEGLGTLMLVATVVGSGIMGQNLSQDLGVVLLANTLPTVSILMVLIALFGPISGAHFNPVVSLVFVLKRELTISQFAGYALAQVIGGVCGTLLAHAMFGLPLIEISTHSRSGLGQWLAEGVATFGLLLTVLLGRIHQPRAVGALVALYIGAAYWFTASTSFANPAVTLARALTNSFSGIAPIDMPGFILAQTCGALLGLGLAGWLVVTEPKAQEQRGDHGR